MVDANADQKAQSKASAWMSRVHKDFEHSVNGVPNNASSTESATVDQMGPYTSVAAILKQRHTALETMRESNPAPENAESIDAARAMASVAATRLKLLRNEVVESAKWSAANKHQ